jgi:hypothetical protein
MRLDKGHLNQFENIQPPMQHALTLPVTTQATMPRDTGITIYVCASTFFCGPNPPARKDVLDVAKRLRLLDDDMLQSIRNAVDILMHAPGGHGYTIDMLEKLLEGQGPK